MVVHNDAVIQGTGDYNKSIISHWWQGGGTLLSPEKEQWSSEPNS